MLNANSLEWRGASKPRHSIYTVFSRGVFMFVGTLLADQGAKSASSLKCVEQEAFLFYD